MQGRHWIALGLALATFGLYAQVSQHEFLDYDDTKHIVLNPDVQAGLSPSAVWKVFTRPHYGDFIPLTYVSLQLDHSLFGPEPAGTLLVNAGLHAANAALCFWVLLALTGAPGRSAAAAALFALHPLRVESVAWAFERKDVLCAFFWMLALWAYAAHARSPSWRGRALTTAAFGAALLAKPMALTLPFALLLLDYWPLARLREAGRVWPDAARLRRALWDKAPLLALASGWLAWTLLSHASSASLPEAARIPLAGRLLEALVSLGFYLWKSVWPAGLAVFYPHDFGAPGGAVVALSAAAVLTLSGLALATARRRPYLLVGWLWFLGTLVPVLGAVQLGLHVRADRYTYLPHMGLALAAVWGVAGCVPGTRTAQRGLALAALALALCTAALSGRQIGYWRDSRSLFEHAAAVTEGNFVALWRLGVDHARAGRTQAAVEALEASVAAFPELAATRFELAETLEEAGRPERAFEHYEAALALEPGHAGAAARYGIALAARGEALRATALLERALEADPARPRAHAALASLYEAEGRQVEAVRGYREALRLEPGYLPAQNNLAGLLARGEPAVRNPGEALRLAREAARATGEREPAVLDTLAWAHAAAGDSARAIATAEAALALAEARGDEALAAEVAQSLASFKAGSPPAEE